MLPVANYFVHNARMGDWSDEIHAVLLQLNGYMNRPDLDQAFLARAGVKLDRALFPLLTRIGLSHPISVVELAGLVGRDHSTVSRQAAKLEALGLVVRQAEKRDQRVRLLEPSAAGWEMLDRFAATRRQFVSKRMTDWTGEERAKLLDLLGRFAATIANTEKTAEVKRTSRHRQGKSTGG
jgi:DNA-binding MarR family transcriptional regulator